MPINNSLVPNLVFPIILAKKDSSDSVSYVEFCGTGFLIGSQGFALTAHHVVDISCPPNHSIVGMFMDDKFKRWNVFNCNVLDIHPTEDVAFLKMGGEHWQQTKIKVSFERHNSALEYHLFGYPKENWLEQVDLKNLEGRVLQRPSLIYSKGHIRRRISWNLLNIKGTSFYELSQPVGQGCSGSPVIKINKNIWEVIGIYIAEKPNFIPYKTVDNNLKLIDSYIEVPSSVSYAVRMDSLIDWKPNGYSQPINTIL